MGTWYGPREEEGKGRSGGVGKRGGLGFRARSFARAVKSGGDQKYLKLKFTKISIHGLLFFNFCNEVESLFSSQK